VPTQEAPDRRSKKPRASEVLLERERALGAIEAAIEACRNGTGSAVMIEGQPGMGKTRLHEAALDQARSRGLCVLRVAGSELERNLAFGVAGGLLRTLLSELAGPERAALLAEAPARIRFLLGTGEKPEDGGQPSDLAVSHGIFTTIAAVAETRPALIAIDDLQWSDAASLRFVLYLLGRLDELSVAVVMTRRPGVSDEHLNLVAADPRIRVEPLAPLGETAVRKLIEAALPGRAEAPLVDTCLEVTAGNPFYLHELLRSLAEEGDLPGDELAEHARALAPDAVTRALRVRVGRLGPAAAALARAVAILGDDVPLRRAAALAGLNIEQAGQAADTLAAVDVLIAREPLRFVHPLVRRAIERDVPSSERATRHLEAARLLQAEGEDPERTAAHLLLGRPQGDPFAVRTLLAAAREAAGRGGWQSAVRYLERALEEPPAADLRSDLLAELGAAEAAIGAPRAAEHLAQAAAAAADPIRRAELALTRGRALETAGRHDQAAEAYDQGLDELPDEIPESAATELRDQLHTAYVVTATITPSLQSRALERRSQLLLANVGEGPLTQGRRLLLAQTAVHALSVGEPSDSVTALAERAWDSGRLLSEETPQWIGWRTVAAAFVLSGGLERSLEITEAALEDARRRGWPLAFATASFVRGLPQLWQGRIDAALADLELARDARRYGWREFARSASAQYSLCLIEQGEFERAEAALTEDAPLGQPKDLEDVLRLYSLAELRLAQGRASEALEHALLVGATAERRIEFFGYAPWRLTAAEAALALGDGSRALELAREAMARAERTRVTHLEIGALRVLGICERDIDRLTAAVELGLSAPPRLETIRALVDLGAALRRANSRAAARRPLQQAADIAGRGGASRLYERARIELAATGARPRRKSFLSGPGSLTPSERRIAELAASGQTNREIARTLFVTPKTVEYHLRNAYRKLEIDNRAQLKNVLIT
jgi:DNA-binding CsgD family transcriptional regulator/predicted negative regulator of RcsB-dependent stress response